MTDNEQWMMDYVQWTMDSNGQQTIYNNQIVEKGTILTTAVGRHCTSGMQQMEDGGWQMTRQEQQRFEAS